MPLRPRSRFAVAILACTLGALAFSGCAGTVGTQTTTVDVSSTVDGSPTSDVAATIGVAPTVEVSPTVDVAPTVEVGSFDPPRPTGVPDEDWAGLLQAWDPAVSAEIFATLGSGTDPDAVAEWCSWDVATLRLESTWGAAESAAERYPDSSLAEWEAFLDVHLAELDAIRLQRCAEQE
jgi:hypothetical protein